MSNYFLRHIKLPFTVLFIGLITLVVTPKPAWAASGIFASFTIVNSNNGGNIFYDLSSSTGNTDFQGHHFGTFGCGDSLIIAGGQIRTFKNNGSNVTGADIYYRVTKQGDVAGGFTNIDLPFKSDDGNGDQTWEQASNTTDVLSGLGAGTYNFEIYGEAQSSDGTHFVSNGGANYIATFTLVARTVDNGNWSSGAIWAGGAIPADNENVEICTEATITLDTDPIVRSLLISNNATLQDSTPGNILTVSGTSSERPQFTNNGTFTAGNGSVAFEGQNSTNGRVWGTSATTFNDVTISYNGSGVGSGDVFGVDFFDQSTSNRATVNGILTINTRGFVAHAEDGSSGGTGAARSDGAPNYGASSSLVYNDLEYPEAEPTACPGDSGTVPFQVFGEWLNQATQPGVPNNVTISADSWISFNCNPGTAYQVGGDFTVNAGVDDNTYGGNGSNTLPNAGALPTGFEQNGFNLGTIGTSQLAVEGDVVNNGTLKQSGETSARANVSFLNIKNVAGTTDKYFGIDIDGNIGTATVKVSGNQATCPFVEVGGADLPVQRCYFINAGSAGSPTVTFYYEFDELRGYDPNMLFVWQDNEDGTWTQIIPDSRSTCSNGAIDCSVTVNALPLSATRAAGDNRFVISPDSPTVVELEWFSATAQANGNVLIEWETSSEINHAGFNVYRRIANSRDAWSQVNGSLIASTGTQAQGAVYQFVDTTVNAGTWEYLLEDVETDGDKFQHTDFIATVTAEVPTAVSLADFGAAPSTITILVLLGLILTTGISFVIIRRKGNG